MKRKICVCLILTLLLTVVISFTPKIAVAQTKETATSVKDEIDTPEIDLSPFDELIKGSDIFDGMTFSEKVKELSSGKGFEGDEFFKKVLNVIFNEITSMFPLFAILLALVLGFSVLSMMKDSYLSKQLQSILNVCLMLSLIIVMLSSVTKLVITSKGVVESLKTQMFTAFPILLTLLFASGGKTSVVSMQPILYFLSVIVTDVISKFVFPLIIVSLVINLLSSVSPDMKFKKLLDFLKSLVIYIIGITLTVFTATLTISGIFSGTYDSVIYRTAKYAVGHSVPIIGGYIKDGLDIVIMSSVMLKNSVGIASLIVFIGIVLKPIISAFAFSLMLKLVAGVSEGFSDGAVGNFLTSTSSFVSMLGVTMVAVTFMYMVSIIALIVSSNLVG